MLKSAHAAVAAGLALLLAGQPVLAAPFPPGDPQTNAAGQRMVAAFKNWVVENKLKSGSVAVMTGTTLIGSGSHGSYTPTGIRPIASDSKAITAICIARLVDANKLTFKDTLKTVLAAYFKKNKPADARIPNITIADLLTHSSGMTYDPSQDGTIEALGLKKTNLEAQTQISFRTTLGEKPGTFYFYNNMNYAVLGFIIETITGEAYQTYCSNVVLKPVKVTDATLNPNWMIMSSWGGWLISSDDYVRFLEYYLPNQKLIKTAIANWPKFSMGNNEYYMLGAIGFKQGADWSFAHEGSWSYSNPTASFGSYFTSYTDQVRYMTEYTPTITPDQANDLSTDMSNAYLGKVSSFSPSKRPIPVTH